jgi:hypothetical protein
MGLSPYTATDSALFFGRDDDIRNITGLLQVEKEIVIYSKPGMGKTSLIQAGIIPFLKRNAGDFIIHVAFRNYYGGTSGDLLSEIVQSLLPCFSEKKEDTYLEKLDFQSDSLWYLLKKLQYQAKKTDSTFIFIFDQFEAIFTYPQNKITDFATQFSDLLSNRINRTLINNFDSLRSQLGEDDFENLFQPVNVKCVFSIKADLMSALSKVKDYFPDIFKNQYEIKPLSYDQAREILSYPASLTSSDFKSPPFKFSPGAVETIIRRLSHDLTEEIELSLLQMVCQRIEQIVIKEQKTIIVEKDLPDPHDLISDYYSDVISRADDKKEGVKEFIEHQLIFNGRRLSLDEAVCLQYITLKTLNYLVDSRLLKKEVNSSGGFSYSISYNRLVEPILKSRADRLNKEEVALSKEYLLQKKINRLKIIVIILSVITISSILLVIFRMRLVYPL